MVVQSGAGGRVKVELMNGVAILTIDRGENRINFESITQINNALDEVERDTSVRALVTTGVGKFYCNGADINWMRLIDKATEETFTRLNEKLRRRVLTFPVPTIAAVNGHAFGFGAFFTLCHDYRLMRNDRGWFCVNEIHLGIPVPATYPELVKIPTSSLTDVVLLGCRVTGPEAVKAGIVNEVYSEAELLPAAIKLAKNCQPSTGISRDSLRTMKGNFYGPEAGDRKGISDQVSKL